MPLFEHQVFDERASRAYSYVSGPQLTHFHKRALNWLGSSWNTPWRWRIQALWVIPAHICQMVTFILAVTAHTTAGQVWMWILTALPLIPTSLFWRVVYLDYLVNRLHKKHVTVRSRGLQFMALRDNRQGEFSDWLVNQLYGEEPYFGRVHPIVDRYLEATAKGAALYENGGYSSGKAILGPALTKAADQAYKLLRPIYEEATNAKESREQEKAARIASETAFREGEEARITQQRIAMAIEDMEAFSLGNQALAQS